MYIHIYIYIYIYISLGTTGAEEGWHARGHGSPKALSLRWHAVCGRFLHQTFPYCDLPGACFLGVPVFGRISVAPTCNTVARSTIDCGEGNVPSLHHSWDRVNHLRTVSRAAIWLPVGCRGLPSCPRSGTYVLLCKLLARLPCVTKPGPLHRREGAKRNKRILTRRLSQTKAVPEKRVARARQHFSIHDDGNGQIRWAKSQPPKCLEAGSVYIYIYIYT